MRLLVIAASTGDAAVSNLPHQRPFQRVERVIGKPRWLGNHTELSDQSEVGRESMIGSRQT